MGSRGRRGRGIASVHLDATKDEVTRQTVGVVDGGLRIRWANLDADEQAELVTLTHEADDGDGFALNRLGRRQRRWEQLAAKGAGADPAVFDQARERRALVADFAELRRKATERPVSRGEEQGVFALIAEQVQGGYLDATDVGLLALIVVAMHTGRGLGARTRVDAGADGPTILCDRNFGLLGGKLDPNAVYAGWFKRLQHLQANEWVRLSTSGPEVRISPGRRLQRALRPPTKKRAA